VRQAPGHSQQSSQKLKTSGRALPEVSEVYHKEVLRLLETKRPSNDFGGYLQTIIHDQNTLSNHILKLNRSLADGTFCFPMIVVPHPKARVTAKTPGSFLPGVLSE
jgi:hypothetical protein